MAQLKHTDEPSVGSIYPVRHTHELGGERTYLKLFIVGELHVKHWLESEPWQVTHLGWHATQYFVVKFAPIPVGHVATQLKFMGDGSKKFPDGQFRLVTKNADN